jgi:cytochrome c biogenesis protein CcmG/thiol:disulfide interchange protein DsbE
MGNETVTQPQSPEQDTGGAPAVHWGRIVVWGVVGLVLVFLALGLVQAFAAQPQAGEAPDFTIQSYGGETYTLSELRGQVVVINFWASWCGPCATEAPDLEAAWQAYKDRGVVFIGVGYVDSDAKAKEFIGEYGITYPNGPDLGTKISDAYNIRGVPETFIVNGAGEITFFAQAPLTFEQLSGEIDKALAGTGG